MTNTVRSGRNYYRSARIAYHASLRLSTLLENFELRRRTFTRSVCRSVWDLKLICHDISLLSFALLHTHACDTQQLTWLVTFVSVILLGIDLGLIAGAAFSVFSIVMRFYR